MITTSATISAVDRVARSYARIAADERPEAWITVRDEAEALADARVIDERMRDGEPVPLAGATLAVKDNIDVAGLPTTAGCPAFAYEPACDATAVARLRAAGAIVIGKTSMDQFATGLVGTRSPYGAVRDARRPDYVAGGSSSGSAVAVALGCAELALGTDTAGSGRVPAAFQGVVGIKPTRGLVPVRGVVPACRSFDCVSVLSPSLATGEAALALLAGPDPSDPRSRAWPADAPLAAPPEPRVAVPGRAALAGLSPGARRAFDRASAALQATGAQLVEVDLAPFLDAGQLLYGGGFVAERYAAVGAFIAAHRDAVDPTVAEIILAGSSIGAERYLTDREHLDRLRVEAVAALGDADAMMLPTTTAQPTIAAVEEDPIGVNAALGRFTTFCNLLDMCAVALPAGEADGGQFGVTVLARAFHDLLAADLGHRLLGEAPAPPTFGGAETVGFEGVELLVVGAHLSGQPLNHELTARGARYVRAVRTAPRYRLFRLDTMPAKPGLVRDDGDGAHADGIEGELWSLPAAGLGTLLAALATPMALGRVELEDGTETVGFLCEPAALTGAEEITQLGGWRAAL